MKKFKNRIIKSIKDRKPFETRLVRLILGVNPNSVVILVGEYFQILIKEDKISISEDISMNPDWVINQKVIDKVNIIFSIYDLPQFTHKYFRWYLGDIEWTGYRTFKIKKYSKTK